MLTLGWVRLHVGGIAFVGGGVERQVVMLVVAAASEMTESLLRIKVALRGGGSSRYGLKQEPAFVLYSHVGLWRREECHRHRVPDMSVKRGIRLLCRPDLSNPASLDPRRWEFWHSALSAIKLR